MNTSRGPRCPEDRGNGERSRLGPVPLSAGAGPHTLLEANGHRADEKLKLDDLYKATEVVACALADMLAPAPKSC